MHLQPHLLGDPDLRQYCDGEKLGGKHQYQPLHLLKVLRVRYEQVEAVETDVAQRQVLHGAEVVEVHED